MKKYIFNIILFLTAIYCNAQWLEKDEYKNKGYLSNVAVITFKQGIYDSLSAIKALNNSKIKIEEQLLKPFQSELFSNNSFYKTNEINSKSELYKAEEKLLRTFVVTYDLPIDPQKLSFHLKRNNPNIETIEPYPLQEIQKQYIPNDPRSSTQKLLFTSKVFEAWGLNKGNPNLIIGVSDAGTIQTHEDIVQSLAINNLDPLDGTDNDKDGYIDNYNGYNFFPLSQFDYSNTRNSDSHGTETAGIIGATFDNGIGMAGIAGRCKIFPLKIAKNNSTVVVAGYSSILFAAIKGFSVLNCSWANAKNANYYSFNQSIVDYAVAKNLAVVSVSGNTSNIPYAEKFRSRYPGGLVGAMGVGEVDDEDYLTDNSSIGAHCDILAQGIGNLTLMNSNSGYNNAGSGTSYASPVVAGAMGLLRSQFPSLDVLQSIQHLRQSVDDITSINGGLQKKLIPGRLNVQKALETDPFSRLGIHKKSIIALDKNNKEKKYFAIGDELNLIIKAKNVLGAANNVKFKLSLAWAQESTAVSVHNNEVTFSKIEANQEFDLGPFPIKINAVNKSKFIYRIDVSADNNYSDYFYFDFNPIPSVIDLKNDIFEFSISLDGRLGYSTSNENRQGKGIALIDKGYAIYEAGLVTSINNQYSISATDGDMINDYNDFIIADPYLPPTDGIKVTGKFNGTDEILITQKASIAPTSSAFAKIELIATNKSNSAFNNMAVGYKFDWDIGNELGFKENTLKLFDEAIPSSLKGKNVSACIAQSFIDSTCFGAAIISFEPNAEVQVANLNSNVSFSNSNIIKALNSKTEWQETEITDISGIIGMQFAGLTNSNESKTCFVCIAGGKNPGELKDNLMKCISSTTNIEKSYNEEIIINPNPVKNSLNITSNIDITNIQIINTLGMVLLKTDEIRNIDVSNFSSGIYFIKINNKIYKFIKE